MCSGRCGNEKTGALRGEGLPLWVILQVQASVNTTETGFHTERKFMALEVQQQVCLQAVLLTVITTLGVGSPGRICLCDINDISPFLPEEPELTILFLPVTQQTLVGTDY